MEKAEDIPIHSTMEKSSQKILIVFFIDNEYMSLLTEVALSKQLCFQNLQCFQFNTHKLAVSHHFWNKIAGNSHQPDPGNQGSREGQGPAWGRESGKGFVHCDFYFFMLKGKKRGEQQRGAGGIGVPAAGFWGR